MGNEESATRILCSIFFQQFVLFSSLKYMHLFQGWIITWFLMLCSRTLLHNRPHIASHGLIRKNIHNFSEDLLQLNMFVVIKALHLELATLNLVKQTCFCLWTSVKSIQSNLSLAQNEQIHWSNSVHVGPSMRLPCSCVSCSVHEKSFEMEITQNK